MVLKIPLIPVYPHGHIRLSFIQLTDTAQQNAGLGTSIGLISNSLLIILYWTLLLPK